MLFKSCLFITFLIVTAYCDDLQDLTKNLGGPVGVDAAKEKALEIIHQKCLQNADEDAYLDIKNSREEMFNCVKGLVNVEDLKKEIESSKPLGTLDEVFKKYCDKTPQFKTCLDTYVNKLERCMSQKERDTAGVTRTVINKLAEFVCFKDGDRIAMFIAEGGPQCLQANQEKIQHCANSTLPIPSSVDIKNLPEFSFDKETCDKIAAFQQCAVTELETCPEPTTANMVDSVIKFMLKATPCNKFKS